MQSSFVRQRLQNVARAAVNQARGDALAQCRSIRARRFVCGGEVAAAVRQPDARSEVDARAVQGGVRGERYLARAFEVAVDDALGMHAQRGVGVV